MKLKDKKIGIGITGSFCTLDETMEVLKKLVDEGCDITPVLSYNVANLDTRFGTAQKWQDMIMDITGKECIKTIQEAEPFGPKIQLDAFCVVPCTGNTLAKISGGITDTPVIMAVKACLRNGKPILLSIASNDTLGFNAKNLGLLLNTKNIYFVPFCQDDPVKKPNSLIAKLDKFLPALELALEGKQMQGILHNV